MAQPSEPRARRDLERAMGVIAYEVEMCALCALRAVDASGTDARNAYLEAELIHARALYDFLIGPESGRFPTDMLRTEFAAEWTPGPEGAVQALCAAKPAIYRHLAHLTWNRVTDGHASEWSYLKVAQDTLAVTQAWAEHVTACEGRALDDPRALAHILLHMLTGAHKCIERAVLLSFPQQRRDSGSA